MYLFKNREELMKIPGYRLICNELEYQIGNNQLPPGAPLPSESELCSHYNASRTTVRKALELLEAQSLIVRKAGVGSFVADRNRPAPPKTAAVQLGVELPVSTGDVMIHDVYSGPILGGIQAAAERFNCQLTLLPKNELLHAERHFDGRIFYTAEPGRAEEWRLLTENQSSPAILINRLIAEPRIGYAAVDYRDAARRVVRRLLQNGANDVILVGSSDQYEFYAPYTRSRGWRDAYLEMRGSVPEELDIDFMLPGRDFEAFCRRLRDSRADMIFVAGGNHLPLTIAALSRIGRRVPEDLGIVCFDNMENLVGRLEIPISFIRVPLDRLGFLAAENLAERARGGRRQILRTVLQPSLVTTDCRYLF